MNNPYKLVRERQISTKMSKKHFTQNPANHPHAHEKLLISHQGSLIQNPQGDSLPYLTDYQK